MFDFKDGSYYDNLRDIYGEDEAFGRYKKKCGKLLVATANENGATRLFVRSVNPLTDSRKKSGWWNTFTITSAPCNAGTYICKVDEVRADKNGYPIFVVYPLTIVDESIIGCDEMMYLFGLSNLFVEECGGWNSEYNHAYFEAQIEQRCIVNDREGFNHHIAAVRDAVRLFINGYITREQIVQWLREPTEWQKQEEAFKNEVLRFFNLDLAAMSDTTDIPGIISPSVFQLTAEKCLKFKTEHGFSSIEQKVNFVKDLLAKYEYSVNAGQIQAVNDQSMWHQIEAYMVFDKARKEANKAAKAAAKKAKKAAAKSTN
jgi:hypothetical protein